MKLATNESLDIVSRRLMGLLFYQIFPITKIKQALYVLVHKITRRGIDYIITQVKDIFIYCYVDGCRCEYLTIFNGRFE